MRDVIVLSVVVAGVFTALRSPWVGVMLWTWISLMNPHRYTYGIAYDAPVAAAAVAATLIGLVMSKERESPFKGPAITVFCIFIVWISCSWLLGLDPSGDYAQWKKVIKVDFMILVALALLHSKKHIVALTWVAAGSLALLGVKGGIYTISTGGSGRVWGPEGSFIEDNNEFALALVMTIPLLRFLQMQIVSWWGKQGLTVVMLLCAISTLGSQSRGGLIAIGAMSAILWWRGKNKLWAGFVLLVAAPVLIMFMPDSWSERMATIGEYQSDGSAMGRISAWWTAWGIALHYPAGIGFDAARPALFAAYSPYFSVTGSVHAAHSIYFQILGNHGFVGLALFLAIWILTWRSANWLRRHCVEIPETRWCANLAGMCQVSLVGYAVGGAFLSLAYFDLPYNVMVLVVLMRVWVEKKGWEREPVYLPGWKTIPGLLVNSKDR